MSVVARNLLTLTHFAAAERADCGPETVIDLEHATFVDPYGLVGIACHVINATDRGRSVRVVAPRSRQVATYLARIGFSEMYEALSLEIDWPLPTVVATDQPDQLMELQPFNDMESIDRLARLLWAKLEAHVDPQVVNAL